MSSSKKILMVSMPTLHFFRWASQLKNVGYDVYWFDVTDGGDKVQKIDWITQITGWKNRVNYPGRLLFKKKLPKLYRFIQKFNERNLEKVFESKLLEIQPDIVHSFALYVSCAPIVTVMEKYHHLKWIYSSWGSDLFYFRNEVNHLRDIQRVLPRVDYLFSDCDRDYTIALENGFNGEYLGAYPGGGGFDFKLMNTLKSDFENRKTILIKGFQGRSGRAVEVLKAIIDLKSEISKFDIIVFGAHKDVINFINNSELIGWSNFAYYGRVSHEKVLELMGESLFYIGNSNSDGMPNTMLEAMCMEVVPIQSNPGGVTEELIVNGENGFLIEDCENVTHIAQVISGAISMSKEKLEKSIKANIQLSTNFEYSIVQKAILNKYKQVVTKE